MSNYKIHPHNECGICSKPRDYKEKTREREQMEAEQAEQDALAAQSAWEQEAEALDRWVWEQDQEG